VNFIGRFSKDPQISNVIKIRPVEAELFHAEGQTDRDDELIVAFLNFAKAPKNQPYFQQLKLFIKFCRISATTTLRFS
jgi:hypothetical protein